MCRLSQKLRMYRLFLNYRQFRSNQMCLSFRQLPKYLRFQRFQSYHLFPKNPK